MYQISFKWMKMKKKHFGKNTWENNKEGCGKWQRTKDRLCIWRILYTAYKKNEN